MGGVSLGQLIILVIVITIFILPKLMESFSDRSPVNKKQARIVLISVVVVYFLFYVFGL